MTISRTTHLQPQRTVADIVEARNDIIAEVTHFLEHMQRAETLLKEFATYGFSFDRNTFYGIGENGGKSKSMAKITKQVDSKIWGFLMHLGEFQELMDSNDRDKLYKNLENPHPVTEDNVIGTLKGLMAQRPQLLQNLVESTFLNRDKSYKSNQGSKINRRQVVNKAFGCYSHWNGEQRLRDIFRVIGILTGIKDDVPRLYNILDNGTDELMAFDDKVKIKAFQNGNCHVWVLDDVLLGMINDVLAYGKPNRL